MPANKVSTLIDAMFLSSEVKAFIADQGVTYITSKLAEVIATKFVIPLSRVNMWATIGMTCINLANSISDDYFKRSLISARNSSSNGSVKYTVEMLREGIQIGTFSPWGGAFMPGCVPYKTSSYGWTMGNFKIGSYDCFDTDY